MTEIVKMILDYGLTGASLVVLSYVLVQQMKILDSIEKRMATQEEIMRKCAEAQERMYTAAEQCKIRSELFKKTRVTT